MTTLSSNTTPQALPSHVKKIALRNSLERSKLFDNLVQDKWLSTREAAHHLGITSNALRIRVCRGSVKAYRFGSHLRFRQSDLNALLLRKEAIYGD